MNCNSAPRPITPYTVSTAFPIVLFASFVVVIPPAPEPDGPHSHSHSLAPTAHRNPSNHFLLNDLLLDVEDERQERQYTTTKDTKSTKGKAVDTVYGVIGRLAELRFIIRFG